VLKRPFSEAVRVGNLLYLPGFTGRIPGTNTVVPGGIQAETRQAMQNIAGALDRYGSDFSHVVKCTVMLLDIQEWAAMNEVYRTYFARPACPHEVRSPRTAWRSGRGWKSSAWQR
jgi:2-iminobutanoate/2-iminopropanoate deaminase